MAASKSRPQHTDRLATLTDELQALMVDAPGAIEAARRELQLPASCAGIFGVAESIWRGQDQIHRQAKEHQVDVSVLIDWATKVRLIPSKSPLRAINALTRSDGGKSGLGPVHGIAEKHPVWCALWRQGDAFPQRQQERFRSLQAMILVMHVLHQRGHSRRFSLSRWNEAGQFVRWVSNATQVDRTVVRRLGNTVERASALRDALVAERDAAYLAGYKPRKQGMGGLAEVIQGCAGIARVQVFSTAGNPQGRSGKRQRRRKKADSQTDPHYSPYTHFYRDRSGYTEWGHEGYTVRGHNPAGPFDRELSAGGVDPQEWDAYGEVGIPLEELETAGGVGSSSSPGVGGLPDIATLRIRAKAKGRRVALHAQRFPSDIRRIRRHHIGTIVHVLQDQYRKSLLSNPPKKYEQERQTIMQAALRLAAIAIATGTHPQNVHALRVVDHANDLSEDDYVLAYSPTHRVWIRPYQKPERNPLVAELANDSRAAVMPRIVLPDALGVGYRLGAKGRQSDLTHHRYATYQKVWTELVSSQLRSAGVPRAWCYLSAMGALLPSWMRGQEEGDHLPVALLFGQSDPRAATHRYYTAFSREDLAQRYQDAVLTLWRKIGPKAPSASDLRLFDPVRSGKRIPRGWAGDDWVPSTASIGRLVESARRAVEDASNVGCAYERHNRMALYTAIGLAIATGFRAIRTPIPDLTAIHRETQTLLLAEKDRSDGSHARLAVIPDVVLDQVDRYLAHVLVHMAELPAGVAEWFSVPATKWRDFARSDDGKSYSLNLRSTLFFWRREGRGNGWRPVELTGDRLRKEANKLISGGWPIGNAGRHYLRTHLTNAGCPATAINTLMGHWQYGEEPWVPESAMNPVTFRETVRPYLDQLMSDVCFVPASP